MKPAYISETWSDLLNVRKPSLAVVITFGISTAANLYLACFIGQFWFWLLFAISFVVAALELRRWLRRWWGNQTLITRNYTELDYQALGITPHQEKARTRSQKVVGICTAIVSCAMSILLHTSDQVVAASSLFGAFLPLLMMGIGYNAVRYTWREIRAQWFRLTVYGLSALLFLYQVLAYTKVFSIPHHIPDHMPELRFYAEAALALAFAPLLLLNIGITVRDSWRQTFGKPL